MWYLEKIKKPGLVKETLATLADLTPDQLYHNYSRGNQT